MTSIIWLITIINTFQHIITANEDAVECPRHRKPWHLISDEERMQFVNGFKTLRLNGVLSVFCETHRITDNHFFMDIHHTSAWLFWHSYFVWEIETQIRNIGDEYKCFSMPYWDITNDAKYLTNNYLPILDSSLSLLGTDGNPDNNNCVEDELWNIDQYETEFLCIDSIEQSPHCCLKRERNPNHHCPNSSDILELISYRKFKDFQTYFDFLHADIHKIVARTNNSHMWSYNAPEDPLFILFHSFIDYIRSMRQDCFDFDKISIDELDQYIPFVYDNFITERLDDDGNIIDAPTQKYTLDTPMTFELISQQEWAYSYNHVLTPRIMFDISFWNISFELGSFWENDDLQEMCYDKLNNTWFYSEEDYDFDGYKQEILHRIAIFNNNKMKWNIYLVFICSFITICIVVSFVWSLERIIIGKYKMTKLLIHNNTNLKNYGTV